MGNVSILSLTVVLALYATLQVFRIYLSDDISPHTFLGPLSLPSETEKQ